MHKEQSETKIKQNREK